MKKLINTLNDDRVGMVILMALMITFVIAINAFSCIRDHQGVRQPAPLEMTECSTCSP